MLKRNFLVLSVMFVGLVLLSPAFCVAANQAADIQLWEAIRKYDRVAIRAALDAGANVNAKNENDHLTPLYRAARDGTSLEGIQLFIEYGADVNVKDKNGRTPLHEVLIGQYDNRDRIINLLIERGADVNAKDREGNTPLHEVSNWGSRGGLYGGGFTFNRTNLIKQLIDHGADVNAKNNKGDTPLMDVFSKVINHFELAKLVIERAADVNSLLHHAAEQNNSKLVKLLIERGANVNTTVEGNTPLHKISKWGLRQLGITDPGEDRKAARLLIEHGANVNAKDQNGDTSLDWAALHGRTEIVKLLIQCGAKVNAQNNYKNTPLYYASLQGYEMIVKILLINGADVNIKNNGNNTPLSVALTYRYRHPAVADLLEVWTKDHSPVIAMEQKFSEAKKEQAE